MINASNNDSALFWGRISQNIALFIGVVFFHFTCILLNKEKIKHSQINTFYICTILLIITFNLIPNIYVLSIRQTHYFEHYINPGSFYFILPASYFSLIIYSLILIIKTYKESNAERKNQLKYVFLGYLLGASGGATTFFQVYDINVYPYGNYLAPLYGILVLYAIAKHNLMDIKIVIRRSLVYTLLITFITIIYFSLIISLEYLFKQYLGYHSLILTILFASVITIAFIPLRNISQKFIDKLFFKGSYTEIAEYYDQYRTEAGEKEKFKTAATLASGIAHEIKNPLTSLQTFFEYYPKKKDDPEFMKTFTRIAPREFERINVLIHELLDFAKPSTPQSQNSDIHTILKESLDLLSSQMIKNNIILETHLNANPSNLVIDPKQIKQAFINIILNSIEAMPKDGKLTVKTTNKFNQLRIEVTDTGCGIPPEKINHIFEPFYTTKETGTGLGLAITKSLIEKNKGKITIESKENIYTKTTISFK